MTVTRLDLNRWLVSSRTRRDVEHIVDLDTLECSCEAALDFATTSPANPCAHVEAAIQHSAGARPPRPCQGSPWAILSASHE